MGKRIGVLVMSYGTPESMDQIEAYYTHIRRGRAPSEEQLQELIERYEAIVGGVFPLRENTNKQVDALQQALNEADHDAEFICVQGLKHAAPFIEDGVQALADQGITEAVGIVLAPHYSVMSVGSYIKRAQAKADELGIAFRFAKCYHTHPDLITAFAERVTETLGKFAGGKDAVRVLFTAHSLPEKILQMGDPYVDQLLETSRLIAEQAGIQSWQFAWQSAGNTPDPWLGPDILDVMKNLQKEGIEQILVCPIGFVSDHLEILYDLDIEAKQLASELGIHLERVRSLNQDPKYIKVLRDIVLQLEAKDAGQYDM